MDTKATEEYKFLRELLQQKKSRCMQRLAEKDSFNSCYQRLDLLGIRQIVLLFWMSFA